MRRFACQSQSLLLHDEWWFDAAMAELITPAALPILAGTTRGALSFSGWTYLSLTPEIPPPMMTRCGENSRSKCERYVIAFPGNG